MPLEQMDLILFEYFLRVAELGSINRAAADLNLSQPALSRHIARLEHELACELFVRSQGGVSLTDAGQLLADRARPLLRQFTVLKQQVGDKAAGQLSVGIPPSWQRIFTSAFVKNLATQYPGIALRIYEGVSNILRDNMMAGLLDLCIVPFDDSLTRGYRQTSLVREPLVLVCRKDVALRPDVPVSLAYIDGIKLILPARPNAIRIQLEHALTRKGMSFVLAVEPDTLGLCMDLTLQGLGSTVMPACALYQFPRANELSWAPIRGQVMTWALFENLSRSHSQAVREARRIVLSTIADSLSCNLWFGGESVL